MRERIRSAILACAALAASAAVNSACVSHVLKHKDEALLHDTREYEQAVRIEDLPSGGSGWVPGLYVLKVPPVNAGATAASAQQAAESPTAIAALLNKKNRKRGRGAKSAAAAKSPPPPGAPLGATDESIATGKRQPEIEDSEGFVGRRPIDDPFRVGEKTTLELSYFGVTAGDLEMEVGPYAKVNGRKAYRFIARAKSRNVFAMVYAVDDWAEAFMDYETMSPSTYALHVKESKQLREQRMWFDWSALKAHFWDRRITNDNGIEENKKDWDAQPFAQNIISGPFYLRAFKLVPGKKLAFRIANEGNNYTFTGEVLRREQIRTPAGDFKTVVVRPQIQLSGVFQPMGEILFWLTDDDRKFFVRIESKIKIGTIVGVAKSIERAGP